MNLVAKLKRIQSEVDELRARLDAMQTTVRPLLEQVVDVSCAPNWFRYVSVEADVEWSSTKAIDKPEPIASDTMRPPAKKRGRPPKA